MSTDVKKSAALTTWSTRDEVREINERLATMMLPGGKKLAAEERLALAQASLMHGLDPFNGEIWIIPGSGVMIGIKGLRKKAHEQCRGNYWVNFVEITNPEQRKRYGIPESALAFECRLFDTDTINLYVSTISKLTASPDKGGAGVPFEIAHGMVGDQPYTPGIGYASPTENSKMTLVQRAQKRAEADAIKRRFDVPFGLTVEPDHEPEAGEWIENVIADGQPPANNESVDYTDPATVAQEIENAEKQKSRQKALFGE